MYENIDHLLADVTEELSFPHNVKLVLGTDEALRRAVENFVNACMSRRVGYTAICGADDKSMLYKFCRHRQHAVCVMREDDCRFNAGRMRGSEDLKVDVSPCSECGGVNFHQPGCSYFQKPLP